MQRRTFLKTTGLTLGALALLNSNTLAQFLADPAYNIKMLSPEIGIFTEKGGTILFMLNKKGIVVVDSQFPDTAPHLIEELKKKTTRPFELLINTHHHGDHSSGNIAFKGLVKDVAAHANSKINQQSNAAKDSSEAKQLFPTLTYTDKWSRRFKREKISLHYFGAGHTNGDSLVHFEQANIMHMGDLVFNRRHPFIDKTAGADIANWIKLLERTATTFASTTFVCGHARQGFEVVVKAADLLAFRDYLSNLLRYTDEQIKAGKTKDEILKGTTTIPGSPEWQGDGIERPLAAAYAELTANLK